MQTYIKMVGSQDRGGDARRFQLWYGDHVNMLMRYPRLERATLYHAVRVEAGAVPDYVCLYEFPDAAAFLDYSDSLQRKDASVVRAQGWGLERAIVVQRSEYLRHSHRRFGPVRQRHAGQPTLHEMHCLQIAEASALAAIRWVDARIQSAGERGALVSATILKPEDGPDGERGQGEWLVALERPWQAAGAPAMLWDESTAGVDELGAAPVSSARWSAIFEEVSAWDR